MTQHNKVYICTTKNFTCLKYWMKERLLYHGNTANWEKQKITLYLTKQCNGIKTIIAWETELRTKQGKELSKYKHHRDKYPATVDGRLQRDDNSG